MSASVGARFFARRALALMIWPDWQYPHCGTSCRIQAACTAFPARVAPIPSTVVTFLPAAADSGVEQERTGCPSRCTVHAPHWAMPQPNLVPVRWSESRSAHKRGVSGAAPTSRVLPLTMREIMKNLLGRAAEWACRLVFDLIPAPGGSPYGDAAVPRRENALSCMHPVSRRRPGSVFAKPGRNKGQSHASPSVQAGTSVAEPNTHRTGSGPARFESKLGRENTLPAVGFAPHRCAERAHRKDRVLAGARHGTGERRQRDLALHVLHRLERVARAAVVFVRRGLPALLRVHAAAQRAYPDRRDRRQPVAPRADVDRHLRHALLPLADGGLYHVALLADIHERLEQQRDLRQRRRPDTLARAATGSGRILSAVAARLLRADQAHRLPEGPHPESAGKARGPAGTGHRARRSGQMTQFLIAYMAPLMFAALVVFLLIGYPVSFALAAIGLSFGFLGIELGLLTPALFGALPERIFGIMSNDTLLAVPFFTFMGLILERSGMAEDLLNTIGQLFGPIRGGLAYAVIFVGALLAATTGVVAASVISMGLISLPIMLRYGYDRRFASGVISASGTLAQIIPPSLVLIVMADPLATWVLLTNAGVPCWSAITIRT